MAVLYSQFELDFWFSKKKQNEEKNIFLDKWWMPKEYSDSRSREGFRWFFFTIWIFSFTHTRINHFTFHASFIWWLCMFLFLWFVLCMWWLYFKNFYFDKNLAFKNEKKNQRRFSSMIVVAVVVLAITESNIMDIEYKIHTYLPCD